MSIFWPLFSIDERVGLLYGLCWADMCHVDVYSSLRWSVFGDRTGIGCVDISVHHSSSWSHTVWWSSASGRRRRRSDIHTRASSSQSKSVSENLWVSFLHTTRPHPYFLEFLMGTDTSTSLVCSVAASDDSPFVRPFPKSFKSQHDLREDNK